MSRITLYERTTIRSGINVNGIAGGHSGKGIKGVIPTNAVAKLSFRLVPDQNPERIGRLFRDTSGPRHPAQVKCRYAESFLSYPASLIDRKHPAVRQLPGLRKRVWGRSRFLPLWRLDSGRQCVSGVAGNSNGVDGLRPARRRIHAPNEKFHLPNFYRGIETSIWYMTAVARDLASRQNFPAAR